MLLSYKKAFKVLVYRELSRVAWHFSDNQRYIPSHQSDYSLCFKDMLHALSRALEFRLATSLHDDLNKLSWSGNKSHNETSYSPILHPIPK